MTEHQATEILGDLAAAYGRPLAPEQAQVWWESALARCPIEVGRRAAERIIAADERMPTPARWNAVVRSLTPPEPVRALRPPRPAASERDRVRALIDVSRTKLGEARRKGPRS